MASNAINRFNARLQKSKEAQSFKKENEIVSETPPIASEKIPVCSTGKNSSGYYKFHVNENARG